MTQTETFTATMTQPVIWLRDNCPCAECRDPRNGQKLFGITDLDADLTVVHVDGTTVTFSDGHVSRFDPAFLTTEQAPDDRCEDAKQLWATTEPPEGDWTRFQADPQHRADCLGAVLRTGFTLLRGVPVTPGAVLDVAAGFGYVRETNYGKLFDVRVEASPKNLAFTGLPITPTGTRCPRSSCCTACPTRSTAANPASSTGSTPRHCCAPRTRRRSRSSPVRR
jgi:gamma-butyrobetaine dioxygenase